MGILENRPFVLRDIMAFLVLEVLSSLEVDEMCIRDSHITFVKMIAISIMVSNAPTSKAIPTLALDIKSETMQINITTPSCPAR